MKKEVAEIKDAIETLECAQCAYQAGRTMDAVVWLNKVIAEIEAAKIKVLAADDKAVRK